MEENDGGENNVIYNSLIISRLQTKMGGVIFICIYKKKQYLCRKFAEEAEKPMKSRQEMNYKKE